MSSLCLGLTAGIALCIFLVERVWSGSGQFYTELMQLLNRALTVPAPALGALGLVADASVLFRRSGSSVALWFCVGAAVLGVGAMALTKLGHFPINDLVLKWDPTNPPPEWRSVQARWSALHVARTTCAVTSFALFTLSSVLRS